MTSKVQRHGLPLFIAVSAAAMMAGAGPAMAQVTEYTSQTAFDAAAPTATTFGFNAGGTSTAVPNPSTFGGLTFTSGTTAGDIANSGTPILFLIYAGDTPTYGVDFLSYQNTQNGIVGTIGSAGTTAIGFQYGSYVPIDGSATVTLSTGNSFLITPSSTAGFIGFTSTSPITSVSIDYPNSYALDLVSVSVSPVPEPATWLMMLIGLGGLSAMTVGSRRRLTALAA
jgi:hypothetical protein